MENSNAQCQLQAFLSRMAEELKDALRGMREAESEVEFELEAQNLERIAQALESA